MYDDFSGQFFLISEIIIFLLCDLVHDVETKFHLSYCKLQFHGHHSYFRKDFQMLLTLKEGYT